MVIREDEYSNEIKNKHDRKTADSEDIPEDSYESNLQDFYAQLDPIDFNNNMFEVEGFELEDMRMRIIDPPNDSEWPSWEDRLDMNDFDFSDY